MLPAITSTTTGVGQNADLPLPPLLRRYLLWTCLLFALSCAYHVFMHVVLHKHGHFVNPLSLNKQERFADFTIFIEKFKLFHTAEFFQTGFPINYPAPACLCLEFFFFFFKSHPLLAFLTFSLLSFAIPAYKFFRVLQNRGIRVSSSAIFTLACLLLSWPILLIVDGANAEVFVWLSLAIGFWAYATDRAWLAAAMFGIAASLKLFPFVFLALFLSRKHFNKLLFGVVVFLVVSVVSLAILGPTVPIAYRGIEFGLTSFHDNYMAMWHRGENGVDHSIFASIKGFLFVAFHHSPTDYQRELAIYLRVAVIGGLLLYFLRIRRLPLLNQVLTLSIAAIYFTAFSGDGTLVHLYYPLVMLFLLAIQAWKDGVRIPALSFILSCLVFTLSMESFLVVSFRSDAARFIGPAHCVSLGLTMIAALLYPLGPPLTQNDDESILIHPQTAWARSG